MRTIFVTGGSGFLGLNLIEALIGEGYRVVAIHRPQSDLTHLSRLGAELRVCGLDDPRALVEAMPPGTDAVIHAAGDLSLWKGHAKRQYAANVEGTRHVVEAALARGVRRFVHTSSVAAYGLESTWVREDTKSTAMESGMGYVQTKWQAEQEVRNGMARGLPALILNPAHILGRYDTRGWARVFKQLRDGKMPGVPPGAGSFCDAREVARAHVSALTKGRVGEQYLLAGTDATYAELTARMAECVGKPAPRVLPATAVKLFGRAQDLVSAFTGREGDITAQTARMVCLSFRVDSSKSQRELDFRPVALADMVRDSYEWLRREGLI